jgi:WD40 repeat protein
MRSLIVALVALTAPCVDAVGFTPDGASVITGSYDGTLRVWSTANWSMVRKWPGGGGLIR